MASADRIAGLEVVRPQHPLDRAEEAAQDPILVEARDPVELFLDLLDEPTDLDVRAFAPRRFEAEVEQLYEQAGDIRVPRERLLHVGLAERAAALAQVLRDRTQDRYLSPRQLGAQDESVESVVLEGLPPRSRKGVLEAPAHSIGLELHTVGVVEAEVVNPNGRCTDRLHLERPFVGDSRAHVFQYWQHVRKVDRLSRANQLERQVAGDSSGT